MTPDSFSDQGFSLAPIQLKEQLSSFLSRPDLVVDIGFESTAPMNRPISQEEERQRFEVFLEASRSFCFAGRRVSFDTYRVENFLYMAKRWREIHPQTQFIFNDVSGVLDEELARALASESFLYIYTFSHIPDRDSVHKHMQYLSNKNVIGETAEAFMRAFDFFSKHDDPSRLVVDPGFGFSKSFEQNWQLIKGLSGVLDLLQKKGIYTPVLLGLSKKSFLRAALKSDSFMESEHLHFKCLAEFMKINKNPLLFRVHDPRIVELAQEFSRVNIT